MLELNQTKKLNFKNLLKFREITVLFPVIIAFIFGTISTDKFLTGSNLYTLIRGITYTGMLSITMTFVLTSKGMDLSADSVAALASVLFAMFVESYNLSPFVTILLVLVIAALIGLASSMLILKLGVPAFVATLGMQYIVKGIAVLLTGGGYVMISQKFGIYSFTIFGMTIDVYIFLLMALLFGFLLRSTTFGRQTVLIGTNINAAKIAGLKTVKIAAIIYMLNAVCAAFASILFTIRSGMGMSDAGTSWALQAIAASVIGGTSIYGGKGGSILGTLLGAIFMGVITNLMMLFSIRAEWQYVGTGLCIVLGILASVYREKVLSK